MKTAIILNGPPGVGKDTIAELITQSWPVFQHHRFKDALYSATAEYFQAPLPEFIERASHRILKEELWNKLMLPLKFVPHELALSPRDAMIFVSEVVVKPLMGNNYFGALAAQTLETVGHDTVVFSDGGFEEEIEELTKTFDMVFVFRLHRDGFDFGKDSRSYLHDWPASFDIYLEEDKAIEATEQIMDKYAKGMEVVKKRKGEAA